MGNRDNFDEEEGFFDTLMQKRREAIPMPKSMSKLLKLIMAGLVVIILGVIIWAVLPDDNGGSDENVPIVRAETTDYKVEPEDKGGMPIPNKDSTIFEAMEPAQDTEKKVESLLEDSEQPLKKEEIFAEDTPAPAPEPVTEPEKQSQEIVDDEKPAAPSVVEEKPVEEKKIVEKKVEEKKVDIIETLKKEAGTDKPKPKPVAKGNTYIQLASVKSDADAKSKWSKLQSSYPALKSLSLRVNRADLGAKGVFYRVQAGPLSSDAAASTCAKVKSAGGDCLIVK